MDHIASQSSLDSSYLATWPWSWVTQHPSYLGYPTLQLHVTWAALHSSYLLGDAYRDDESPHYTAYSDKTGCHSPSPSR